jgi:hypothetical protein
VIEATVSVEEKNRALIGWNTLYYDLAISHQRNKVHTFFSKTHIPRSKVLVDEVFSTLGVVIKSDHHDNNLFGTHIYQPPTAS